MSGVGGICVAFRQFSKKQADDLYPRKYHIHHAHHTVDCHSDVRIPVRLRCLGSVVDRPDILRLRIVRKHAIAHHRYHRDRYRYPDHILKHINIDGKSQDIAHQITEYRIRTREHYGNDHCHRNDDHQPDPH